jgi:hypothetical protein
VISEALSLGGEDLLLVGWCGLEGVVLNWRVCFRFLMVYCKV